MKKFYVNAIVFAAIFAIVLVYFDFLSMCGSASYLFAEWTNSAGYLGSGSDEIKPYIESAQTPDGTTKLIIGDSVCHQMYSGLQEFNEDFLILGSNGAITVAGQYILAREYLDSHPEATDIFLIILPASLGRTFDTKWGYQYAVMPFVETDTISDLDQNTIDIMEATYGKVFLNPKVVSAVDLSGVNRKLYLNILRSNGNGYALSNHFELADQYICKINNLCEERGVSFHLYPCPVSEVKRDGVENLAEAFENSAIYEINPDYLDMVYYYPAEQSTDGSHFSGSDASQESFNEKIKAMYEGRELLSMLELE